jgi:RHH-type transcriptional regulator, proline utilization regulon repressor / proline dehydrogenase / delta 1-pyrroline-5-carboxylate dehydrogenase
VGDITQASAADVETALAAARPGMPRPRNAPPSSTAPPTSTRQNFGRIFAILAREAGKNQLDAVGELREAVDFLRYYAARITPQMRPRGGSPASRPGTFRWRSSPARSPARSPPATPCWPSPPSRRR